MGLAARAAHGSAMSARKSDTVLGMPAAPPLLERLGVRYFRRLSGGSSVVDVDGIHVLNRDERARLRAIQRGAIVRACVAGALSTVVAGTTEIALRRRIDVDHASLEGAAEFWAVLGGVTAVAAVLEIAFLYWDGLRSVHRLAMTAGLDLFPTAGGAAGEGARQHEEELRVAGAMARAALELPNPTAELFGVDPRRDASRVRLALASVVYKAKVSVSNFVVKALVRRALGRAMVRSFLPLVAVPITAAWNGFVCWLVLREARIRAMGPSATKEMVAAVFDGAGELSVEGRGAAVRAVASSIVRTRDMHPNLAVLLGEVIARVGDARIDAIDDARLFLLRLGSLSSGEQALVLRVLAIATIIDGRVTSAESRLLADAQRACGRAPDLGPARRLRRAFLSGTAISPASLREIAG